MATHSSIPVWEIPCTKESAGLQSMRLQRVGHDSPHIHTSPNPDSEAQSPFCLLLTLLTLSAASTLYHSPSPPEVLCIPCSVVWNTIFFFLSPHLPLASREIIQDRMQINMKNSEICNFFFLFLQAYKPTLNAQIMLGHQGEIFVEMAQM